MSSSLDYKLLQEWCEAAVSILGMTGVSGRIVEMQRRTIAAHAGTQALYEIADSLAEGLSHLSPEIREAAQRELVARYGLGFDFFVDKRLKRIRSVLKRGAIRTEDEFRYLSDFATDTTRGDLLLDAVEALLSEYATKTNKRDVGS